MPATAQWFLKWFDSPYYHKLYFERDEQEAAAFIKKLVERLNPPSSDCRMLDVACGRGRHSRMLASMGYDVTGFDVSPVSIEYAHKYETERLHFFVHDMRLPFWINYFDYAFNLFTSFGYFRTEREHYDSIRTIASALKPNGKLVLDYMNVHYAEDHLVHKSEIQIGDVNFIITKWFDETHFFKKIEIEDERLDEPIEFTERVAKFTLGDFNDMLAYHNLIVEEVYGDYQFSKYDVRKSPKLILQAHKGR